MAVVNLFVKAGGGNLRTPPCGQRHKNALMKYVMRKL